MVIINMKQEIVKLLKNYHSPYKPEEEFRGKMLGLLERTDNVFSKDTFPGHFTASAWILNHDVSHVLLTLHAEIKRWFQLGGHFEASDRSLAEACHREATEESGIIDLDKSRAFIIDLDIHPIPGNAKHEPHLHYDISMCFLAKPSAEISRSSESRDLKWISLSKVKSLTQDPSVIRMCDKTEKFKVTGWFQ